MKKTGRLAWLVLFTVALTPCQVASQLAERYFDAPETTDQVVITVLYPSLYTINDIKALSAEGFSPRSILEDNPPSYEFHRSIWAWFIEKTKAHRRDQDRMDTP
jgi:hypothetical protein